MNAPDPIGDLDKLVAAPPSGKPAQLPESEWLLRAVLARLIRIETRLVVLMLHGGVDPNARITKEPNEH